MGIHPFLRGREYSRKQISDVLGGGVQDYLPHQDGVVVYGAFSKDLNPGAPNVILPGTGPEIERWAHVFAGQEHAIPVFLKRKSNVWYCMGDFRCKRWSEDEATISEHSRAAGRDDVTMVLFLERERLGNDASRESPG
jgi:hypothetical protein